MTLKVGDSEVLNPGIAAAVSLTAAKLKVTGANGLVKKCERVEIYVETFPIRVRRDGTAPTSTVGKLLNDGDSYTIKGHYDLANLKMIGIGGTADVFVEYLYSV